MAVAPSNKLKRYVPANYPQLGDLSTFIGGELSKIAASILLLKEAVTTLDPAATALTNAANDAAAATAGVALNGLYHTAGAVKVRLV